MQQRRKKNAGFTLIEILFTMAIGAFALLCYLGATLTITQHSEAAYEKSVAMQDALRVVEQMRNTSLTGTFPANVTTAYPNNTAVAGFTNLKNQAVNVSYVNTTADPLDVTVSVTWMERGVRSANAALRTLITKREMT